MPRRTLATAALDSRVARTTVVIPIRIFDMALPAPSLGAKVFVPKSYRVTLQAFLGHSKMTPKGTESSLQGNVDRPHKAPHPNAHHEVLPLGKSGID